MINFGNMENALEYFQKFLNNREQASDTVTLTLRKTDKESFLSCEYDQKKVGLLLGLLASDDRLTEMAVFALVKVMCDMTEEETMDMLVFLHDAVNEAREEIEGKGDALAKLLNLNIKPNELPS